MAEPASYPIEIEAVTDADLDLTSSDTMADVRRVVAASSEADGASPLDEAAELRLSHHGLAGTTLWVARGPGGVAGLAWWHDGEVDLVVAPAARRQGVGGALADRVRTAVEGQAPTQSAAVRAWSHGHHPGAVALAQRMGLAPVRELWVMRRRLSELPSLGPAPEGVTVRAFEPGRDEEAFLTLNAESFAHHAEQGSLDAAGLAERMGEAWFDPTGFFLAERDGGAVNHNSHSDTISHTGGGATPRELVGFHWTKVHDDEPGPSYGEVYVVGVSPRAQGGGLGRLLTLTGLRHLADRGLAEVILYVEGDNAPAVAVYSGLGFGHAATDTHVQYA